MTRSKVVQTETRELATISKGKIQAGDADIWNYEHLTIPPLPPTNLRGCHLIRMQYDIFVSSKDQHQKSKEDQDLLFYYMLLHLMVQKTNPKQ